MRSQQWVLACSADGRLANALWCLDCDSPNAKMTPEEARVTTPLKNVSVLFPPTELCVYKFGARSLWLVHSLTRHAKIHPNRPFLP